MPVSGGSTVTKTQTYGYDALNRLTGMCEGAGAPSQTYSYTANHNMFVATNDNSTFAMSAFTPTSASAFDAVNNRLGINNAIYDSSGTGTQTGIGGYTNAYDAENRITTSKLTASVGFSYDGLGQRIQKINCPGGENPCVAASANAVVTTFLYDSSGNLAVESGAPLAAGADGLAMCGTVTCYLSVDQVGSTRLVTDSTGAAVRRYDYLPYGQEIPVAGSGWRTTSMGYAIGPDGFSIKYTGQYRDPETGLDYFNARYYSPAQGRFVSPDPGNAGANLGDSATWNGYAYVGGNPVNVTDPSGLGFWSDLGGFFAGILGGGGFGNLGVNSSPWNEQVPVGAAGSGLGGLVNSGGVFGQGQTDPFVFSVLDASSGSAEDQKNFKQALEYLGTDPGMSVLIRVLVTSKTVYRIRFNTGWTNKYDPKTDDIWWDPHNSTYHTRKGGEGCQSPALHLGHEFAHAAYPFARALSWVRSGQYGTQEERRVIEGPERQAAQTLGEFQRTDHQGAAFWEPNSRSRSCRFLIPPK